MKPYIIEGCPARYYIGGVVRRQSEALHRWRIRRLERDRQCRPTPERRCVGGRCPLYLTHSLPAAGKQAAGEDTHVVWLQRSFANKLSYWTVLFATSWPNQMKWMICKQIVWPVRPLCNRLVYLDDPEICKRKLLMDCPLCNSPAHPDHLNHLQKSCHARPFSLDERIELELPPSFTTGHEIQESGSSVKWVDVVDRALCNRSDNLYDLNHLQTKKEQRYLRLRTSENHLQNALCIFEKINNQMQCT